jgi:Crp-like helix-turn-helix protein
MIGTTRETVTRAMARFKKQKLIEIRGATLLLRNKAALHEIAGRVELTAASIHAPLAGSEESRERLSASFRVLKDKEAACVAV